MSMRTSGCRARKLSSASGSPHVLAHALGLFHDVLGLHAQVLAGGREPHLLAGALEKLGAQFFLQLADGHAQRRLGDGQALGCAAEVQLLGQHQKVPQLSQLHGVLSGLTIDQYVIDI